LTLLTFDVNGDGDGDGDVAVSGSPTRLRELATTR
jgi:hypothetical protein